MNNTEAYSEKYKEAGVDITAGYKAVDLMKGSIAKTLVGQSQNAQKGQSGQNAQGKGAGKGALFGIGGFGGLFELDLTGLKNPVLVSGTDGVGTKLKIAFSLDKHDTIGIDCVAMCVNDIICVGAKPLFFLDYIATGKNYPERIASIVSGVAEGCVEAGAVLIGGETAEMPGFYAPDEYDLAGFSVGVVDKSKIVDNSEMKAGDLLVALPSSGLHSNGFSLVRHVFSGKYDTYSAELSKTIGEELLTPTKIYVKPVLTLLESVKVKGISHITGGGFYENIPRSLPEGFSARIEKSSIRIPVIFDILQKVGDISEREMFNTFNMGVGMCVVVSKDDGDKALRALKASGVDAYIMGEIAMCEDGAGVEFCS